MKICMYIRRSELEYLYNVIKDIDSFKTQIDMSATPFNDSIMVSINYEDYTRLNDASVFCYLISL